MTTVIILLIILACFLLGFIVLIQNPKGGGLAGQFGSLGTQVMGVKRSTDVMEKATWTTMGTIALLSIAAIIFYPKLRDNTPAPPRGGAGQQQQTGAPAAGGAQNAPANAPAPAPAPSSTTPAAPGTQQ